MKRLYYLTSEIDSTEKIATDLHNDGITDWNFHVLSKDREGLYRRHVHSANFLQEYDVIHSALRGGIIGVVIGLTLCYSINMISGYAALSLPLLLLIGALFGSWLGAMIGMSHENYKIARFHNDLEAGRHLLLVDVHKREEARIRTLMKQYHPEAILAGEDSTLINPFKGHMGMAKA